MRRRFHGDVKLNLLVHGVANLAATPERTETSQQASHRSTRLTDAAKRAQLARSVLSRRRPAAVIV